MDGPLQISFKDVSQSDAIEARVQQKFAKLMNIYPNIVSAYVTIEAPHQHRHQGFLYQVAIRLSLPEGEVNVSRRNPFDETHRDIYVAIRDAFDAAKRQLREYGRIQRGDVKTEVKPPHGKVAKIFPEQGYGFLETIDGREIYFDEMSVLNNGFQNLSVGQTVRFSEEMGDEGPQASTVAV
ncbi:MAG: HPF/RaiA family ribosome-associated protein [Oligoflexus sp.]